VEQNGTFDNSFVSETQSQESRNRHWDTREGDIRAKLLKMTRAKENISFVYRECLRSMLNEFSDLVYFSESDELVRVKAFHANPERAIAKITQEDSIILPVISISQTTSKDDNKRRKTKVFWFMKSFGIMKRIELTEFLVFLPELLIFNMK